MSWQRVSLPAVKRRVPRLYLDESVDTFVQDVLRELKITPETAAQAGLLGHSDQDQFAHCWKQRKVLVTFDFDFMDYKNPNLPDTRNPGVIVLDCDNRKRDQVLRTVSYMPRVAEVIGDQGWRHTRTVVGPTGHVRIRRRNASTGATEIEEYRFTADDRLERWIAESSDPPARRTRRNDRRQRR